mmetsp:Transcript_37904/g.106508  ORF Transcript_37904/g.106508 Transcript_37904/m.106508 type:complete len:271 (+) Transcript_37904:276-1088(+)
MAHRVCHHIVILPARVAWPNEVALLAAQHSLVVLPAPAKSPKTDGRSSSIGTQFHYVASTALWNKLGQITSRYPQPSGSSGCSRWHHSDQHQNVTQKESVSHRNVQLHGGRLVKEPLLQRRARFCHRLQVLEKRGHGHSLAILDAHRGEDLCHLLRSVVDVEVAQSSPHLHPANDAVAVVEQPHRGVHRALLRRQQARHLQAREALADLPSRVALLHLQIHGLLLLVRKWRERRALRELPLVGLAQVRRERAEDAQSLRARVLLAEQGGH